MKLFKYFSNKVYKLIAQTDFLRVGSFLSGIKHHSGDAQMHSASLRKPNWCIKFNLNNDHAKFMTLDMIILHFDILRGLIHEGDH